MLVFGREYDKNVQVSFKEEPGTSPTKVQKLPVTYTSIHTRVKKVVSVISSTTYVTRTHKLEPIAESQEITGTIKATIREPRHNVYCSSSVQCSVRLVITLPN